ncbi:MAG: hypothetical protein QOG37_44 [Mycobacterium sp.]|nr:hypothetical protein [Mycobacterium sp.]
MLNHLVVVLGPLAALLAIVAASATRVQTYRVGDSAAWGAWAAWGSIAASSRLPAEPFGHRPAIQ